MAALVGIGDGIIGGGGILTISRPVVVLKMLKVSISP
jgi:hypothetical protein